MPDPLPTRPPRSPASALDARALVGGRQVVVVSNRQPYRHAYDADRDRVVVDQPVGGLTAALDPVMQTLGGTWIAWGDGDGDRDAVDDAGSLAVPPDDPSYRLQRVWLSADQVRGYYDGFSNQVLWPICHGALTRVRCAPGFWGRYRRVNDRFAAAVVESAEERPLVWFQDYHLALAPAFARPGLPEDAVVLLFWHIPWPAWDTFRACPHGSAVLEGLLATDVLGFHVPTYRTNFLRCVDATLPDARVDWTANRVHHGGTTTAVEAIPMGVPVERIRRLASSDRDRPFDRGHDIPTDARIAIGVDRLDYTKGILERLWALERLWSDRPRWRGALTYVQIGSESRSRVPAYREVQTAITDEIDRINRRFGTDDWEPIVHVTRQLPQTALYARYRHADVALVSPIRDGMNLVAQEFVAAQADDPGVLVLSDQAGSYDRLGEAAVSITPTDIEGFAEAIDHALSMPVGDRRRRMVRLQALVSATDLTAWLTDNLGVALDGVDRSVPST